METATGMLDIYRMCVKAERRSVDVQGAHYATTSGMGPLNGIVKREGYHLFIVDEPLGTRIGTLFDLPIFPEPRCPTGVVRIRDRIGRIILEFRVSPGPPIDHGEVDPPRHGSRWVPARCLCGCGDPRDFEKDPPAVVQMYLASDGRSYHGVCEQCGQEHLAAVR